MSGACPFCEAGPEDDDTDECLLRGLSHRDAERLAESREFRIATLQAEADALRAYADQDHLSMIGSSLLTIEIDRLEEQ